MATMTGRLYALASSLGMVERNNREDAFHQLVFGITGKSHVSELTAVEANAVPGMMTVSQQKKAWSLVYRLDELEPKEVPVIERLLGAIEKILGITASKSDPFRWINFDDGTRLIEQLKRYVRSAERKAFKGGSG